MASLSVRGPGSAIVRSGAGTAVCYFVRFTENAAVYLFAPPGAHHLRSGHDVYSYPIFPRCHILSVVVALDYDNRDKALAFVDRIDPRDCRLKVGKEMFTLLGPQFVRDLHQRGFEVFSRP